MNVTAGVAAATMLAGAAVGFASPATGRRFQRHLHPEWARFAFHLGRHAVRARLRSHSGQHRLERGRPPVGRALEIRGGSPGRDKVQQRRRGTRNGHLQGRRATARGHLRHHESRALVSMGTRARLHASGLFHVDQNLSRGQKPIPTPIPPRVIWVRTRDVDINRRQVLRSVARGQGCGSR